MLHFSVSFELYARPAFALTRFGKAGCWVARPRVRAPGSTRCVARGKLSGPTHEQPAYALSRFGAAVSAAMRRRLVPPGGMKLRTGP